MGNPDALPALWRESDFQAMSNRNSKFTLVRKPTVQGAKLALAKGRKRAVPGPKKIPSNRSNPVIRKAFSK